MLRRAIVSLATKQHIPNHVRRYAAAATSAQKRALKKEQLEGKSPPVEKAAPPPPPTDGGGSSASAAAPSASATPTPPPPPPPPASGGEGGGGSMLPFAVVGLAALAGGAYYMDAIPGLSSQDTATPVAEKVAPVEKEEPKAVEKVADKQTPAAAGNRVVQIDAPTGSGRSVSIPALAQHPADGSRVAMRPPVPKQEISAAEAAKELQSSNEASMSVEEAHQALRANLDESLFSDLDTLSATELKVRVVQLASEMKERTKWEAVRLKEFLAMKEKETGDKYMETMQKQRLELETILARKLREQEDALTRQSQAAIQEKEATVQAVVKAATESQQAEHEAELQSAKERLEAEINAKAEVEVAKKLAEEKANFAGELESKVTAITELSEKLKQLESALSDSRSFESGSLKAHKMSAAAIALTDKLATSRGASQEVATLANAASENNVISAALSSIPASAETGVPTLAELQARFEKVQKKARQAAFVPEGRSGLEGQLMGMAFSTLKYAPSPDDVPPEDAKDDAEYVLARASRHVQLGELDRAVEQLDKLKGQAAFTIKDWKQSAKDRVAADKALHVIKMECALMNKSLSDGGASVASSS